MAIAALLGAALTLVALAPSSPVTAATDFTPPPVRHVWVINLENASYRESFGDASSIPHPYLKNVLPSRGVLLRSYYGTAHNSLPNYIAEISGQSPTPGTQSDDIFCAAGPSLPGGASDDIPNDAPVDPHGQIIGQGCTYPPKVKTLADQLAAKGLTWKGYMEGLGEAATPGSTTYGDDAPCAHSDAYGNGASRYAAKHNPYIWFHSLIDQPSCAQRVQPLTALGGDLESVATTANLSFITPDMCNDGHDCPLNVVDAWLKRWLPLILASPAYRQDGMLVVTFDESDTFIGVTQNPQDDDSACCNEIPGPNTPMPGIFGPGGGLVGTVILSPYVRPGTTSDHPYNHYSLLRSLEDAFGITTGGDDGQGHLGYAGSYDAIYPGPGSFGCDVYTAYGPCQSPAQPPGPTPTSASSGQPTGPRPADGSATWRNPLPTANDLTSINCPSASSCFAAGEAGTIVTTTDSGSAWSPQSSGTAADLAGISCPSTSTCVAVGAGGTILETGDGGATWTKQQSGTTNDLKAVSCATGADCHAVGDGGTVLASSDGGQSWIAQGSGTDSSLLGISCPDASTCYAVGDISVPRPGTIGTNYKDGVLKTADGGETWRVQDSNIDDFRLHAISCPNQGTCFIGSEGGSALWSTTNGGGTWSSNGNPGQTRYLGLACASATSCVAVGARKAYLGNDRAGGIVSTSDGRGFSGQDSGTSDWLRGVSCPTASACYAVGDRGTIVARADGAHWGIQTRTATAISASLDSPWAPATRSPQLLGTSCPTTSACLAVGDWGLLVGSGDGGAHWSSKASGTDERLYSIGCASASTCVAVGDGGTIVATQTGATWSPQPSGTTETLTGADCPTTRACFAVGDQGTILATGAHGGAWEAQGSKTSANLNAIGCASAKSCVAVGSLGTILATANAGKTWTEKGSGTTAYLGGVACPSAKACYAVGEDGTVLATTDGGKSWSLKSTGVGDELDGINCTSATNCVATGGSGTVLSTADGGTSWTVQGTGTARDLRSIDCSATTACIAAGDTGTILAITPKAAR